MDFSTSTLTFCFWAFETIWTMSMECVLCVYVRVDVDMDLNGMNQVRLNRDIYANSDDGKVSANQPSSVEREFQSQFGCNSVCMCVRNMSIAVAQISIFIIMKFFSFLSMCNVIILFHNVVINSFRSPYMNRLRRKDCSILLHVYICTLYMLNVHVSTCISSCYLWWIVLNVYFFFFWFLGSDNIMCRFCVESTSTVVVTENQ